MRASSHRSVQHRALAGILVAASVAVFGYWHTSRVARRERMAQSLEQATNAVGDYQDLPCRVRRRPSSEPAVRSGLAERISGIHSRLDFHSASGRNRPSARQRPSPSRRLTARPLRRSLTRQRASPGGLFTKRGDQSDGPRKGPRQVPKDPAPQRWTPSSASTSRAESTTTSFS